ncbi:hypothetical protein ACQ4PT_049627 [Festuca glaucescens]
MEVWLSLCFIALSTAISPLWFLKHSGRHNKPKKQLPPGPWTLPIIGSLHHVVSVLPHRTITELCRQYGPLMFLKLGEVPAVFVSSAEAAALVMKANDPVFAERPCSRTHDIVGCGGKGVAYARYGDHWREMRKVCIMELLSPKQVRRMESIRAEEVHSLVGAITASAGATVNVSHKVVALSNHVATRAVFGGKFRQQGRYLHELHQAFTLLDGFCLVDLFPSSRLARWLSTGERRVKRCYGRIQPMIADVIQERKATRATEDGACSTDDEDLLDVLLRLQKENSLAFPITTEIIGAVLFDMFAGATEATGTVLEWAMSELMCHPEAKAKAQLEIREVLGQGRAVITNSDLAELSYFF